MAGTELDFQQAIRNVYDEALNRLRVDAVVSIDGTALEVDIQHTNDSIRLGDGTNYLTSTTIGGDVGLDVNIINPLSVEIDAGDGDNIAISDGTNTLSVNTDGSINVKVSDTLGTLISSFSEITSVASSTTTDINSYTVPIGKTGFLQKVYLSGTNIAEYEILINGIVQEKTRTWFGNSLNEELDFSDYSKNGIPLIAGDIVKARVTHNRPSVGDFNARIQVVEI